MSWPSDTVAAMLGPCTVAVVCLAVAAAATLAVRETPGGVAPSPPALPPNALIVALSGNDANPGTLAQPLTTIQRAVNAVPQGGTIAIGGGAYAAPNQSMSGTCGLSERRIETNCEYSHPRI